MSQYFENDKSIKSEVRMLSYKQSNYNFDFYSDNGVFSKGEIDYGSHLLMQTFLGAKKGGRILDVGGGIGVISIVLSSILRCNCDMVEVNDRAIELTNKNIKLNHLEDRVRVIKSDAYENVNGMYDFVITNPPIRAGKKVIYKILFGAFEYLNDNGELWFVMRKNHGALSAIKDLENEGYKCEVVNKEKGFFIVKVIR